MDALSVVQEMVRRIVNCSSPARVILFGSQATGDAGETSDVDLLVLFRTINDRRECVTRLYEALAGMELPKDIVVALCAEYDRYKGVSNTVFQAAAQHGVISMTGKAEVQEIAGRWLARADGHIAAAAVLVRAKQPETFDAACYHAHESVVAVIKGLLTVAGTVAPRIHDLEYLHRLLPESLRFPANALDLAWLSTYGIERWWDPDGAQAERALQIAIDVRRCAVGRLC